MSNIDIDEKMLKQLDCPFTWEMEAISNYERAENPYHDNDDEEFSALLRFMRKIMSVYVFTEINDEKQKILKLLKESKKELDDVKKSSHPEISSSVAEYVYRATSCFVYKKFNMIKEFNEAFAKVKDVNFSSLKDKSTIDACRSIAWSKYHQIGTKNAEKFIRQALDNNPKCDLYCFILAKNLRRQRRNNCIDSKPGAEEVDNFTKAYKLSKNQVYELFVAQMHREAGEMNKSKKIYEKIFYSDSKSNTVLLRLALGFIRLREFRKAEVCLDQVKGKNPNQSMYLHYRGIYLMKQKRFKEALPYFEKAMAEYNFSAEKHYIECQLKLNKNFAITDQLLKMLDKYKQLPNDQLQDIILDLGFCFWKKKEIIEESLNYFLRAVEIDPKARCFLRYYDYMKIADENNVYATLNKNFLPSILNHRSQFSKETLDKAEKLKDYCDKNQHDQEV